MAKYKSGDYVYSSNGEFIYYIISIHDDYYKIFVVDSKDSFHTIDIWRLDYNTKLFTKDIIEIEINTKSEVILFSSYFYIEYKNKKRYIIMNEVVGDKESFIDLVNKSYNKAIGRE